MPLAFAAVGVMVGGLALAAPVAWQLAPFPMSPVLLVAGVMAAAASLATLAAFRCRDVRPILAVAGTVAALQLVAAPIAEPIVRRITIDPIIDILRASASSEDPIVLYSGYFPNLPFHLGRIPYFVVGNRELDFGISIDGNGPFVVDTLAQLRARIGDRKTFFVLHPRDRDVRALQALGGSTRVLYRGRRSVLLEHLP
jgi:hypothetical protein